MSPAGQWGRGPARLPVGVNPSPGDPSPMISLTHPTSLMFPKQNGMAHHREDRNAYATHAGDASSAAAADRLLQRHRPGDLQHGGHRNLRHHRLHGRRPGQRASHPRLLDGGRAFRARRRAELLRTRHQLPEFRRRIRLPDPRLRPRMGLHDRLGVLLRRLLRTHRGRRPGLCRLPGLLLPGAQAGQRRTGDRQRRILPAPGRGPDGGVGSDCRLHRAQLHRRGTHRQGPERADRHKTGRHHRLRPRGLRRGHRAIGATSPRPPCALRPPRLRPNS